MRSKFDTVLKINVNRSIFYFCFIGILFLCKENYSQTINKVASTMTTTNNDSIYLINQTKTKLGFVYNDKYLNLTQIHVWPDSNCNIASDSRLLLTQTNENQNFYLLYPGDTLYVSVNKSGDAILSVRADSIRNNELRLSWEMNDSTPLNFWKINSYRGKYFDRDYKKMDSIYIADYKTKMGFLENYKKAYPISGNYENLIKTYLKSQLYGNQLWMGTVSKANIDQFYLNYLMALKSTIDNLVTESKNPIYAYLQYGYIRFAIKNLFKSDAYMDSLYSKCKMEVDKKTRDLVLLKIVKDEIQNNKNSNKWFIKDFITTCKNNDYRNYVMNMVVNSKLTLTAGKNNILINKDNQKLQFDSLIKTFRNNIVYIDIWASWCAPCRAEMPNSMVLRNKYKNRKVVFMYLSIDDDIAGWKKANTDEKLDQHINSYLLLNAQNADLLKKLKISSIPRHIIIDKNGEIINSSAPGPGDASLNPFLNKLLIK